MSAVADENGMPLQEYYYTPYGSISNVERDTVNSLRFIGRYGGYKDDDSGLVYFWHRWYDERDGRWISRDPVNAGLNINLYPYSDTTGKFLLDLNLYRYAFNDPTFWIDSSGLCPDRGCTERRNCDKTDSNDDLGNCLKNAKDNYLKGLAIYFGATAPFHEAVVIGCWATGPGFAACMASVNLILEIPDLIAIGALTTGYLQIRQQCFDLYGCKGK
ncbi:MAG: RHS repeat-associated core domain-containing protein [Sulfolobaceae archaeon]